MSLASWNWRKAIAGVLSFVALITVTGGLVSCTPEVEEEDTEEGVVAPEVGEEEDEDEGEED